MSEKLSQLRLELKDSHEVDILFRICGLSEQFGCFLNGKTTFKKFEDNIYSGVLVILYFQMAKNLQRLADQFSRKSLTFIKLDYLTFMLEYRKSGR